MQFDVWSKGLASLEADCLVVGVFEDGELAEEAKALDTEAGGKLGKIVGRGDFSGKTGETLLIGDLEGVKATRVLLVGLGSQKNFNRKIFRKALGAAVTASSAALGAPAGADALRVARRRARGAVSTGASAACSSEAAVGAAGVVSASACMAEALSVEPSAPAGGPAGRDAARRRRRGGRVSLGVLFGSEPSMGSVDSSMRAFLPSGSRAPRLVRRRP